MPRFMLYAHSITASDNMVHIVRGEYTKRRGQRTLDFFHLYFEFQDKKYIV